MNQLFYKDNLKKDEDQIFSIYKSNKNEHTYRMSIN